MSKERPFVPDNSPKPGTEGYRRAKEKINQEGWEDNAAVIIGTKEELGPRRDQLLGGRETADLGTYVYRNAVTYATSEELKKAFEGDKHYADEFEQIEPGVCFLADAQTLYFKSKDGAIKELTIKIDEIGELKRFGEECAGNYRNTEVMLIPKLQQLGFIYFKINESNSTLKTFGEALSSIRRLRSIEESKSRRDGFRF